jgi:hypothetical protein
MRRRRSRDGHARRSAHDLVRCLSASDTLLAGSIDGEDNSRDGVFVTAVGRLIRFECAPDGQVVLWEPVDDPASWLMDFEAIEIAIAMKEAGVIA